MVEDTAGVEPCISTHALTWSATFIQPVAKSASAFQLTRSRGARLGPLYMNRTNIEISTHALTWSATIRRCGYPLNVAISTHALTWSATF